MRSLTFYLRNPKILTRILLVKFSRLIPDYVYIKFMYKLYMNRRLNLRNPVTFTEKLQWLKLYNRHSSYPEIVDKYTVKDYVAKKIGSEYVIPTIGVWNKVSDIEWSKLPNQFVIKTTHGGSGKGVVLCKDKQHFNTEAAKKQLSKNLRTNLYWDTREWPYKNLKKRIIAEELLIDENQGEIKDYKFFCFNGKARFFKIDFGRFFDHHANYYDLSGNLLPFGEADFPPDPNHTEIIPSSLPKMIELSEALSSGFKFIRVDFYCINEKVYFGELTFFPTGGFGKFTDDRWDVILGEWLKL